MTHLAQGRVEIISSEDSYYKDYVIVDAVRASMSIPVVFQPHQLRKKRIHKGKTSYELLASDYVDGGLLCNFAVTAFDTKHFTNPGQRGDEDFPELNKKTLGFRFEPKVFSEGEYRCAMHYVPRIVDIFYNAEDVLGRCYDHAYHRGISVNTGNIGTLSFRQLDDTDKQALRYEAWLKVCQYFHVPIPDDIRESAQSSGSTAKGKEEESPPRSLSPS